MDTPHAMASTPGGICRSPLALAHAVLAFSALRSVR
jgi:hypothetical protein